MRRTGEGRIDLGGIDGRLLLRGRAGGAAKPAGPFTAKLTVNGRTYTQTFEVKPDPRVR